MCDSEDCLINDLLDLPKSSVPAEECGTHRYFASHEHVETIGDQLWIKRKHGGTIPNHGDVRKDTKHASKSMEISAEEERKLRIIRQNLPPDVEIYTCFGKRRVTYADYTASGRPLAAIEEYISKVVGPLFANTHTENSATGLQTTHFREEARDIVLNGCGAKRETHSLVFVGSGVTAAINKFISMMDIAVPFHLRELVSKNIPLTHRPLVMVSDSEHHSNEIMWRENYVQVIVVPRNPKGELSIDFIKNVLENEKNNKRLIIGSFTAGSNVTGLRNNPYPVASLLHEYGALSAWDYAGAGAYVDINMSGDPDIPNSHLDAIYLSPHKFVGGPGSPGVLIARTDILPEYSNRRPPTVAGGGTVQMVWNDGVIYEDTVSVREEAGTPQIVGAIRCGLVFRLRDLVGPKRIEKLEGYYASRAVERLQKAGVWVMGDDKSNITSPHRLSITSFNIMCPKVKEKCMLHPHFVSTLLNDLYGIQSRSGCSCAGPLGLSLFKGKMIDGFQEKIIEFAEQGFHAFKPGWSRVNFNYFISEDEFEFIIQAIEQIAEHGYKLLPLYALCMKTGGYFFNSPKPFDKFDGVRMLKEFTFSETNDEMEWIEPRISKLSFKETLDEALSIYDRAPELLREILFRFRDFRRLDSEMSDDMNKYRYFVLGSDVLEQMINTHELELAKEDARASDPHLNPLVLQPTHHKHANPMYTFGRSRG